MELMSYGHIHRQNCETSFAVWLLSDFSFYVEEKVVVIHRGMCNNKEYYRLSHDVVTWDVDRDVSTAYC